MNITLCDKCTSRTTDFTSIRYTDEKSGKVEFDLCTRCFDLLKRWLRDPE